MWVYFQSLICWSILTPIPHCLGYSSFIISLEVSVCLSSVFFLKFFCPFQIFCRPIKIRVSFLFFYKNLEGILDEIIWNLQINWGDLISQQQCVFWFRITVNLFIYLWLLNLSHQYFVVFCAQALYIFCQIYAQMSLMF